MTTVLAAVFYLRIEAQKTNISVVEDEQVRALDVLNKGSLIIAITLIALWSLLIHPAGRAGLAGLFFLSLRQKVPGK